MSMAIEQWLREDTDRSLTFHWVAGGDGYLVATVFWGGTDPDSGAPREHAFGSGATPQEAFEDAWGSR